MSYPDSAAYTLYLLVVDDETAFRHVLADEGYVVRVSGDGLEALALIPREAPRLVRLDAMMPRLSGHEVLAAMGRDARLSSVPVCWCCRADEALLDRVGVSACLPRP